VLGLATGSAGEGGRCRTRWSTLRMKVGLLRMYLHLIPGLVLDDVIHFFKYFITTKFSDLWENVKLCGNDTD
jgi:hypothetical protein